MPYKLSGDYGETLRIMVFNESDWSIESNTVVSGYGNYELLNVESGYKTVMGRSVSSGRIIGYSKVEPAEYEVIGAIPVITPSGQDFVYDDGAQEITITCSGSWSVYYTTDGTVPSSSNGTLYSSPFEIHAGMTIKAVATSTNPYWADGAVASETYTFYTETELDYYKPLTNTTVCGQGYYDLCEVQWIPAVFPNPYYLEVYPSCSSPMRWGIESWGGGLERIISIRFPGVEVPRGKHIQRVDISIYHDSGNPEGSEIHGIGMFAIDDYSQFEDEDDWLSRDWTESTFAWNVTGYQKNTWYTISSEWTVGSVQEVINLPSWNSGQALVMKLTAPDTLNDPTNKFRVSTWNEDQEHLPRLKIWYRDLW